MDPFQLVRHVFKNLRDSSPPIDDIFSKYHREEGSSQVPFRPLLKNQLLDRPVGQFLASLCCEQWVKLDKLGSEMRTLK